MEVAFVHVFSLLGRRYLKEPESERVNLSRLQERMLDNLLEHYAAQKVSLKLTRIIPRRCQLLNHDRMRHRVQTHSKSLGPTSTGL